MKPLLTLLRNHGYVFMIVGMAITALGAFILFQAQRAAVEKTTGLIIGITGLIIYLLGRIGIFYRNSLRKKK